MDDEDEMGEALPKSAVAPAPRSAEIRSSASPVLVRLAGLVPLAMTALGSCAQPVTDSAERCAREDESHSGVADYDGENCTENQCNRRNADVDGVLGVCHTSKGSRANGNGVVRQDELGQYIQDLSSPNVRKNESWCL